MLLQQLHPHKEQIETLVAQFGNHRTITNLRAL